MIEWIFNGVGIFILSIIITIFLKSKNQNTQSQNIENVTTSGSTIINQANQLLQNEISLK